MEDEFFFNIISFHFTNQLIIRTDNIHVLVSEIASSSSLNKQRERKIKTKERVATWLCDVIWRGNGSNSGSDIVIRINIINIVIGGLKIALKSKYCESCRV